MGKDKTVVVPEMKAAVYNKNGKPDHEAAGDFLNYRFHFQIFKLQHFQITSIGTMK
jgi:hypothetical protein